jgi:hypothetical protein
MLALMHLSECACKLLVSVLTLAYDVFIELVILCKGIYVLVRNHKVGCCRNYLLF